MTDELGAEARDLITRALNDEPAPDARELSRIRRGVLAAGIGTGAVLGSGNAAALGTGGLLATVVGSAAKGGLLGAALTLTAGGAWTLLDTPSRATPTAARAVAPSAPSSQGTRTTAARPSSPASPELAVAPPTTTFTEPEPAAARRPSIAAARSGAANPVVAAPPIAATSPIAPDPSAVGVLPGTALAAELAALRRVQTELRAGRGAEALRVLDETASNLGNGQLRQERLAAEVLAACQSGQLERARRAARSFLREDPATPASARIRASCVGDIEP